LDDLIHKRTRGPEFSAELSKIAENNRQEEKLHSKRVEKISKYTRNEWRRLIFLTRFECSFQVSKLVQKISNDFSNVTFSMDDENFKKSLEQSDKINKERMEKLAGKNYTRNEWRRCKKLHSKREEKM
jgi:hypothetical protein